jgi:methyl-accepting chemotaxis protein
MNKLKLTVGTKLFLGSALLVLIFVINSIASFLSLNRSTDIIKKNTNQVNPSLSAVSEFILLSTQARMLSTNWVYLPRNNNDKKNLLSLHQAQYPQLKDNISRLSKEWNQSDQNQIQSAFKNFETILDAQQKHIIRALVNFDSYEDPNIKFAAEDAIERIIVPQSDTLNNILEKLIDSKKKEAQKGIVQVDESFTTIRTIGIVLFIIMMVVSAIMIYVSIKSITLPVKQMHARINELSLGKLPEENNSNYSKDEIGDMGLAVNKLISGLRSTSNFAENIGKGNYNAEFQPLSEDDVLGNSLLEMRQNLRKVADEEKVRAWAIEGLAKFGEILRNHTDDTIALSDQLIRELVKYTQSNQGAIFLIEEPEHDEPYLQMAACYAWDRKKYLNQKIEMGDGLIGQSWQEKDSIYLTDVPHDFVTITSGLGEANPTNILIVPLIFNDKVQGILETASLNIYEPHEVDFVKRIAESIASTISTVKTNEKTRELLEQSQQMTEEMQAQEEEMRQNMEELEATQEEMRRNEQKYIDEIHDLRERLQQLES